MNQLKISIKTTLGISVWDSIKGKFKPYFLTVPDRITGSQLREEIQRNTGIESCYQLLIKDTKTAGNGYTAELQERMIDHWAFSVTENIRFIVFDTRKSKFHTD